MLWKIFKTKKNLLPPMSASFRSNWPVKPVIKPVLLSLFPHVRHTSPCIVALIDSIQCFVITSDNFEIVSILLWLKMTSEKPFKHQSEDKFQITYWKSSRSVLFSEPSWKKTVGAINWCPCKFRRCRERIRVGRKSRSP